VCNSGHFNVEINIAALKMLSKKVRKIRKFVDEYVLKSGKKIYLLSEGRLVNLSAAEGHPATVMDMSFSNQALCIEYIVRRAKMNDKLRPGVYTVPREIDSKVASLKLALMGIKIDTLTNEQKKYLESWSYGT
jgi:adenosylhomocysteinase